MAKTENKGLTDSQKAFCREYVYDWNGSRAYKASHPHVADSTARTEASKLLTKPNIQAFWKSLCEDDEKYTGVSRRMVIMEHKKIINTSIFNFNTDWITRKEFDSLTEDQKGCVAQIETQTRQIMVGDMPAEVEFVKLKLYDKQKSLDSIGRMLGYDSAEKIELSGGVKSYKIVPASARNRDSGK